MDTDFAAYLLKNSMESLHQNNISFLEKSRKFTLGVMKYQNSDFIRKPTGYKIIYQNNQAELLNYGDNTPEILLIPSIINKSYIFDLHQDYSFIKFLQAKGLNIATVSWFEPKSAPLTVENYIESLTDIINKYNNITLIGYCLGGSIALSAASKIADKINKIVLISTPWQFLAEDFDFLKLYSDNINTLTPSQINMYFYLKKFEKVMQKYIDFYDLSEDSLKHEIFVATERWLSDGMNVAKKTLHQFREDFFMRNIKLDSLENKNIMISCAENDHIVPLSSILPVASNLKASRLVKHDTGHLGMMASLKARDKIWEIIASFIIDNNI